MFFETPHSEHAAGHGGPEKLVWLSLSLILVDLARDLGIPYSWEPQTQNLVKCTGEEVGERTVLGHVPLAPSNEVGRQPDSQSCC